MTVTGLASASCFPLSPLTTVTAIKEPTRSFFLPIFSPTFAPTTRTKPAMPSRDSVQMDDLKRGRIPAGGRFYSPFFFGGFGVGCQKSISSRKTTLGVTFVTFRSSQTVNLEGSGGESRETADSRLGWQSRSRLRRRPSSPPATFTPLFFSFFFLPLDSTKKRPQCSMPASSKRRRCTSICREIDTIQTLLGYIYFPLWLWSRCAGYFIWKIVSELLQLG